MYTKNDFQRDLKNLPIGSWSVRDVSGLVGLYCGNLPVATFSDAIPYAEQTAITSIISNIDGLIKFRDDTEPVPPQADTEPKLPIEDKTEDEEADAETRLKEITLELTEWHPDMVLVKSEDVWDVIHAEIGELLEMYPGLKKSFEEELEKLIPQ